MAAEQPAALFTVITVHCFFGCPSVIRDIDPQAAHDRMEEHYASAHSTQVSAAIMSMGGSS